MEAKKKKNRSLSENSKKISNLLRKEAEKRIKKKKEG